MMSESEITALVYLLDDEDEEVATLVEEKLRSLGEMVIPLLEDRWVNTSFSPLTQKKIEDIIHELQYKTFYDRMIDWKEQGTKDILEGMWIIATYQYPDLSLLKLRQEIDQIYYDVWMEIREEMHPMDKVRILNSVIFGKYKFGANTKQFHAVSNSMINVVLESKKGNPISLCIIYLLIAQKLGLPLYGVNLPNLFILTYKQDKVQFYINVFNKGLVFSRVDIDNYIAQLNIPSNDIFYEPCEPIDIIRRTLRNMIVAFEKLGEDYKVKEIQQVLDEFI